MVKGLVMAKAMLFVVGASGAGKTTAVQVLSARDGWRRRCYFFDSIGVPTPYEMKRCYGGGERWQAQATQEWVERLAINSESVVVLEGQTRPSFIRAALAEYREIEAEIVLLNCQSDVRQQRLIGLRGQPELATAEMDHWAAYLRGQADALGLPMIETSEQTAEFVATQLQRFAEGLLEKLSDTV